jgi:hypothetical protein
MIPGLFGDTPPAGSEGVVFYEDTDFQTRLVQLAADAQWPAERTQFFTGNVDVQETNVRRRRQHPRRDARRRRRRVSVPREPVHEQGGRRVRARPQGAFDPEGTASGPTGLHPVEGRRRGRGRARLGSGADPAAADVVAATVADRQRRARLPEVPDRGTGGGTFVEADIPGQIRSDATSITKYGYRSWSAPGLLTLAGTTTGNDAKDETALYGDYVKANYKDPHTRVEALTFKSMRPEDPRAKQRGRSSSARTSATPSTSSTATPAASASASRSSSKDRR